MATKQKSAPAVKKVSKNEKYLGMVFSILKKRESIVISDRDTQFNNTELRLLSEIITAKYEGNRLISTQLAKLLGITRSAVSQIVNRLEAQGVVERVADDVDRKIAYIEVTEAAMDAYGEDLKSSAEFIGKVVKNFGEDNFNQMCKLFDEFVEVIDKERANGEALRFSRRK